MNFPTRRTRRELIAHIEQDGHSIDKEKLSSLLNLESTPNPWYINGLLGFAAWFSAICFLAFLTLFIKPYDTSHLLLLGLGFSALGIYWERRYKSNIFVSQLALILSIVGVILFAIGMGSFLYQDVRSDIQVLSVVRIHALIILLFEVGVFILNSSSVRRYIAINNISIAFLFIIHIKYSLMSFQFAYMLLALSSLLAWEGHSRLLQFKGHWQSLVRFAMPMLLLALLLFTVWQNKYFYKLFNATPQDWWISTLAIAVVYVGLIVRIYQRLENPNRSHLLFAIGLVVLIAILTYHSPGIIGSLFVLTLAYAHGHKILLAFSIVLLTLFTVFYYYNMTISLLDKSISLMSVGSILIIAAWVSQKLPTNEELVK